MKPNNALFNFVMICIGWLLFSPCFVMFILLYYIILYCIVANQMWCLALHLPLLVGDYVPEDDEHWELLCVLLAIIRIAFAPTISENQVAYLQKLIQEHHEKFKELFPQCNVIPKMHYMIHMPRIILQWVHDICVQHCTLIIPVWVKSYDWIDAL